MERIEEKYKKQSIERFEFISEENLNKLRNDNVKTLDFRKFGIWSYKLILSNIHKRKKDINRIGECYGKNI